MDRLRNLYSSYGVGPQLSESASKAFIISKIMEKVSFDSLLENRDFLLEIVDRFDQLSSIFESMVSGLDKKSITQICKELGKNEIAKSRKKSEVVETLVAEVPFSKIWQSRHLREKLKPKLTAVNDLRRIKTEINAMGKMMQELDQRHTEKTLASIQESTYKIQQILTELQKIRSLFKTDKLTDLETYLQAFYEQALETEGPLSAESLQHAGKRLLEKLSMDEWMFTLRGLELLLLHYFLSQVKTLKWQPSLETFMQVVREEFENVKVIGEQAEIPTLRENVCARMGISEEIFDNMLIEAWEKEFVRLDVGAPIGRSGVRYLRTKGGNLFFYVKLRK